MGKKKLSLKPVQRGFATTSVASKQPAKVEETPEVRGPAGNRPSGDSKPSASGTNRQPDQSAALAVAGGQVKEDWEDEAVVEQAALQQLVDRLQEKGDKEVARIIKTVEFDKRLANSFSILEINHDIRDQVLTLARDEDDSNDAYFTSEVSSSDRDKVLSSVFVTYQVLARLGFAEGRILECIEKAIGEGKGWEHALEWMWLHLTEDECLSRGDYARKPVDYSVSTPTQDFDDEPLVDTEVTEAAKAVTDVPEPSNQDSSPPEATQSKGPLFQSLETAHSDSDSDGEIDLNKDNAQWASLMLELDNLRIAASGGPGKSKGKKGKSSGVILETPEMRRLKERIAKIEKEYMFSRKEADALLRSHKSRRDAEALERRLRGGNDDPKGAPSESTSKTDSDTGTPAETSTQPNVDVMAESGDEEGGLFGSMLDEPPEISSDTPTDANTTVAVRSMPIPKQFAFAGNTPKALLRSTVTKSLKSAIITYARLSGASKAVRVGLEIRLSLDRRRVWRMTDIACEDVMEAENYVSTLALSEFSATGLIPGVNWRSMPLAFRDLWEELEAERKVKEDEGKRKIWSVISKIVDGKMKNGSTGVSIETTKPAAVNGGSEPESMTKAPEYSEKLQTDFERRRASQAYQHMRKSRETLPIASFREQIISTLESSQIMVLSGETGCGKSTQLPSFILEDQLSKGLPCKIFVTEPRRISAISLAQRVSQELGDAAGAMGSNSSLVGYSIRLESKVSAATRLAFVTNGIALRMLESGSNSGGNGKSTAFDDITHIIVDEVHERSIESDFLLIVLRSLMQQRKDLKVILMSATLDAEKISGFFGGCPCLSVPGRTFPVQVNYLEDAVELAGWHIDESSQYAVRARNAKTSTTQLEWNEDIAKPDDGSDDDEETQDPTKLASSKYSARTVSTVNLLDSRQIPYDLIVRLLEKICFESPQHQPYSQATLVFMPGLAEIRRLNDMLQGHPEFGSAGFIVYPLHSTISSEGQSAVFDTPPPGVRKIVISTNIAETGVTIPDITCVIDSGKHREMRYDEKRQISRLVETYIAKSNAKQRRGRAGRVQEGLAFHLFTKARHETRLAEHPIPEMLRLSLQDLALRIKILKIKLGPTIESVLLQALDPPSPTNIQRAIASLVEVKALTVLEEITPMGRLLSKLPMDVHLGKFLLVAALFKCLDPALTIAATLNSKSPFVTPFGHENAADTAKRGFAVGNSDFLTIANVFDSWRRASDNPNFVRTFCKRNFVSQQNLQQIEELRQQLLSYLIDSSFVTTSTDQKQAISQARYSRGVRTKFVTIPTELNVNAENAQVLGAALAAGLYPKLINLDSAGGLKTIINQQPVAIHPSSINFRTPKSEFGTSYLTYFTILQSKKLYAWETGPVDDKALALLCGDQVDLRLSALSLQIDRKIRYQVNPKTALAIKYLREQFAATMAVRLRGKSLNDIQEKWFELGLRCLKTGLWEGEEPAVGVVPG